MKTKQEQIEKMAKVIQKIYITKFSRNEYCLAQDMYNAGYRKQSDTAREILQYLYEKMGNVSLSDTELVLYLAALYGVEVEE